MDSKREGDTMCKDPINPNLPHWRRPVTSKKKSLLLQTNVDSFVLKTDKATTVLHKLYPASSPLIFTPVHPFKLSNILVWYSKPIIIQQIRIGDMNQLVYPVYEQQLTAPDTIEVVEQWFRNSVLPRMLRANHAYSLDFMVADRNHPMTIEFEGSFDVIGLYGAEFA
jgi:hypothetical protein